MTDIDRKRQAIAQFERGEYREAFLSFVEVFQESTDPEERDMVFQILEDGYYRPNAEEMERNYLKNFALLAAYPYQWGVRRGGWDQLPVRVFPVTETEYSLFDREAKTFTPLRSISSETCLDYLLQDLTGPVFRENECNMYHLKYLWDNIRRSEDYGGDNHIYLYYDGMGALAPLLALGDLAPILKDQKAVFLVGEENRARYPVDFKGQFQIDYAGMGPQPVRIEEIQRICFWYKHAHSGTGLSREILGSLCEIQMSTGYDFNTNSRFNGGLLYGSEPFRQALTNPQRQYTVGQIREMVDSGEYDLHLAGLEDFLVWLEEQRPAPHEYSVKELFCGYFLFRYSKRGLNPRIAPMILYDPHMWDPSIYCQLVLSFPYYTVLTCVREPIMTFIRCQQIGIVGWNGFSTEYMLAFDYAHGQFLHPDLQNCYHGFRFEDLKMKPEIVCRALCRHLNVPYNAKMLEVECPVDNAGLHPAGIDYSAPLHWDLSACLSEFDSVRLKMFYDPILKYYGYPGFSFEEHPLSEELVRELFKYPFRFEYANPKIYGRNAPSWEQLHSWVQKILQGVWRKPFISPKLIPLEDPAETGE